MKFLLGKKLGMTSIYKKESADNVTLVEIGKNVVTTVRTEKKDGYQAVQISMENEKSSKKDKKKTQKPAFVREFRVSDTQDFKIDQELSASQFKEGDKVVVTGIAKGKGFQGVVKRHGFAGSPASHGHRHDLRSPGSIGSAFPERVMKGKKMAGRMGGQGVTTKNVMVSHVDVERKILALKGAVPGTDGSFVIIRAE